MAQDLNIEQYTKVAAAIRHAIQGYHGIYDKKNKIKATAEHHWIAFSRVCVEMNPTKNRHVCHQGQEWVRLQFALHLLGWQSVSPTICTPSSFSISNSSCLATRCQPLDASFCTVLLYFSRYCPVRFIVFAFSHLFFLYVFVWEAL